MAIASGLIALAHGGLSGHPSSDVLLNEGLVDTEVPIAIDDHDIGSVGVGRNGST